MKDDDRDTGGARQMKIDTPDLARCKLMWSVIGSAAEYVDIVQIKPSMWRKSCPIPVYMMIHLQPPTSSLPLVRLREGWSFDPCFGSASSARMENDRTEMWMTVGVAGGSAAGRLLEIKVESSASILPA